MGLLNTYWALILPPPVYPLGIFMIRSFIVSLPQGLDNSARLDGAGLKAIFTVDWGLISAASLMAAVPITIMFVFLQRFFIAQNLSEACALSAPLVGVFNSIGQGAPKNAGAFRRVEVKLRQGRIVGAPAHPTSCSVATTNVADHGSNPVQRALAELKDGVGMAETGGVIPPSCGVVSGRDLRIGHIYVNNIYVGVTGGAGAPTPGCPSPMSATPAWAARTASNWTNCATPFLSRPAAWRRTPRASGGVAPRPAGPAPRR